MGRSADRRIVILAHGQFPDRAKTALGVMRYGDDEVVAVLDRANAGDRVHDHVETVPDAPIVAGVEAVDDADALVIGIAPIGGGFDESWRPDITGALRRGWDVVAGLHAFLGEDEEFAELATDHDAEISDVRRPPPDLTVAAGVADEVAAHVVVTVGTDCGVGKMTTTFELVGALRDAGYDAAAIPTGQTGIMVEGWGYPIDRVVSDFVAGAVEELILERGDDHEVLVVEGQGSITHPAYSGVTCGIVHGAMGDAMVLCHEAGRERVGNFESFALPSVERSAELYESIVEPVAPAKVVAGSVNTSGLDDDASARAAVDEVGEALGSPATDVIRFGTDPILGAVAP